MVRACAKRPVSYESLERAVSSIEQTLLSSYDREIPSVRIGELTMQELQKNRRSGICSLCIGLPSVCRRGKIFFNELKKLMGDRKEPQNNSHQNTGFRPIGAGPVLFCLYQPVREPFQCFHLYLCAAQLTKGFLWGTHFQVSVRRPQRSFQLGKICCAQQVVHFGAHLVAPVGTISKRLPGGRVVGIADGFGGGVKVCRDHIRKALHLPAAVKATLSSTATMAIHA